MEESLIKKIGERKLREVMDTLEEWAEDLERSAIDIKREYEERMYASRNGPPKEWFRYAVRVRGPIEERARGVVKKPVSRLGIEWRRMEWKQTRSGKKYQAQHIRKGVRSNRYATGQFRPTTLEERRMVESAEDRFCLIRAQVETIGSMRKVISNIVRGGKKVEPE